jgi:hypothetical protein
MYWLKVLREFCLWFYYRLWWDVLVKSFEGVLSVVLLPPVVRCTG